MISLAQQLPRRVGSCPEEPTLAPTYLAVLEIALIPQPSIFILGILELGNLGRVYRAVSAHARRLGPQAHHASNRLSTLGPHWLQRIVRKLDRSLHGMATAVVVVEEVRVPTRAPVKANRLRRKTSPIP